MNYSVIILAAGKGERMSLGYNKLLHHLEGVTIIERTVSKFLAERECEKIVLAIQKEEEETFHSLFEDRRIVLVMGGETREQSVWNALDEVTTDQVLVHDGARCNVSKALIQRVVGKLDEGYVNVIPTVKPKDAVIINGSYPSKENLPRLVQTPQGFKTNLLKKAMEKAYMEQVLSSFKDDSSIVVHYLGFTPEEVEGEYNNIKITT